MRSWILAVVLCISLTMAVSSLAEYRSPSFITHILNGSTRSEIIAKFNAAGLKRCYLRHCCPMNLRCCEQLTCCNPSTNVRVGMIPCFFS